MHLVQATSETHWQRATGLIIEYTTAKSATLGFQDDAREIGDLPAHYASPYGCLLLAEVDHVFVGCEGCR